MWNEPLHGYRTFCLNDEVYCLAYGSNLDVNRMKTRCPGAEVFGVSMICGYRLLFKKSCTGSYATIEQDANCCVPVGVYRMTVADELRLDRFEGFPKYYYKREFLLPIWTLNGKKLNKRKNCVVYIMHENRILGEPSEDYFRLLDDGYDSWGFDKNILDKALSDSIGEQAARQWLADYSED